MMRLLLISSLMMFGLAGRAGAGTVLEEKRPGLIVRAVLDRDTCTLVEHLVLELTVEGPEPLSVQPPRPLLSKETEEAWRVKELEAPSVVQVGDGRQRWRQKFLVTPFVAATKIGLATLIVKSRTLPEMPISWSGEFTVKVTTSIAKADPRLLQPSTGPEPPPDPPKKPLQTLQVWHRWLIVGIVAFGTILTLAFVAFIALRGRVSNKPVLPDETWALTQLAAMPTGDFARAGEVLRQFIAHRFQIPTSRMTTAELVSALPEGRTSEELCAILERTDLAKFANGQVLADDWSDWNERTVRWINSQRPPAST